MGQGFLFARGVCVSMSLFLGGYRSDTWEVQEPKLMYSFSILPKTCSNAKNMIVGRELLMKI